MRLEEEIQILSNPALTHKEICELLNCSTATISRKRKKHNISLSKGRKPGKLIGEISERVTLTCKVCNSHFKVTPSYSHRKYCSKKCMYNCDEYIQKLKDVDRDYQKTDDWGSWAIKPDRPEYKSYRGKVDRLTEKTYAANFDIINPNKVPRTIAGVDGGYQLDHIKPVRQCFDEGISVEEASSVDNLRMLPWKENIMRTWAKQ